LLLLLTDEEHASAPRLLCRLSHNRPATTRE
jgi:hypothetical protein